MLVQSCIPVVPSSDLEKSPRIWVDGLGLSMHNPMRKGDRLVGCMVHNEHMFLAQSARWYAHEIGNLRGPSLVLGPERHSCATRATLAIGFSRLRNRGS
jgi:hypothetical protein